MATSAEPYYIRLSGLKGMAMFTTMKTMKIDGVPPRTLVKIDTEGIHWYGVGNGEFVVYWDEIEELVQQRYMGVWGLYVSVKDPDAVMKRHPMKNLPTMGPSPFVIPKSYGAKLEDVGEHIRRFSDVPVRKK